MIGERFLHVVERNRQALGLDDELLDLVGEKVGALFACGVWKDRDDIADAWRRFEEAFADEVRDDLVGGVGVDLEFLREGSHGREGVPGAKLSGDHRLARSIHDLLKERDTGPELYAEGNHVCTITHNTPIAQGDSYALLPSRCAPDGLEQNSLPTIGRPARVDGVMTGIRVTK